MIKIHFLPVYLLTIFGILGKYSPEYFILKENKIKSFYQSLVSFSPYLEIF